MPTASGRRLGILVIAAVLFYALLSLLPAYAAADITHNLVGWWKFDEGTSTYAHDSSGIRGHNGRLTSTSTLPQWVSGKFGGSVVIKHCIQQGIVEKGISPVSSRLRQAR